MVSEVKTTGLVFVVNDVKILMRSYDVTTQALISRRILTLAALRSFVKTNATMLNQTIAMSRFPKRQSLWMTPRT